jgi:hypothetical protein
MIGEGINKQRITNWGSAMLFGANSPTGSLRLKLLHGPIDDGQRLLRTWELEALPSRDEFRELVDDIDREAGEDAAHLTWGVQRYFLIAETKDGRMLGSLTMRYSANGQGGDIVRFADSEPATPHGQVAQAMRNTEAAYRTLATSFGMVLDALNRRLGQQDQMIEKMLSGQARLFEMMGEASDKRFEREVWADTKRQESEAKLYKEINELDRKDMLWKLGLERLAPLLPAVIATITGRNAPPTPTTPREEVMAALLDSLSQDQFAQLGSIFTPEQLASFGIFVDSLKKAKCGEPIVTPPGTSSPNCKPSEETGMLAVMRIKRDLLPWAIEQLRKGPITNPPFELAVALKIFRLFVGALPKEQYAEFVTQNEPFTAEERVAFAKLAEFLKLAPEGVPVPVVPPKRAASGIDPFAAAFGRGQVSFPNGIFPSPLAGLGVKGPKKPEG